MQLIHAFPSSQSASIKAVLSMEVLDIFILSTFIQLLYWFSFFTGVPLQKSDF